MPSLTPPVIPAGRLAGSGQPVLSAGDGLVLRPWFPDDAAALLAAYADPDIERWHAYRMDSADEAASVIQRWTRGWRAEAAASWAVVDGTDGPLTGRMALRMMDLREGVAECAYWTVAGFRGRGVAVLGLAALTSWAFAAGFHRLFLRHSVGNPASCRVAEKCDYALEGTEISSALHADGWHDMHVHARTRPT
ncbi:MAG TPA: GNAT family N-acetyltransferase [Trebonia sp.]|jgi:RimJ/RimL family protein N-acetyltransferase|nr:GNAT family N-acetyltransferase [Trebonia sp.]